MDEQEIIGRLAKVAGEVAEQNFMDELEYLGDECATPIERALLGALILQFTDDSIEIRKKTNKNETVPGCILITENFTGSPYKGAIYPQMPIGRYIADFYFEAFDTKSGDLWFQMIIECDGHDFHEKSKEQSKRDKMRDRWFQSKGILVMRFTGAEVWRDPEQCASEIEDAFYAAYHRRKRMKTSETTTLELPANALL